jgi:uncharacterized short protein YbdD (DUF466 family)
MADIDLTPTEEMASNAARGLELREKHGRGGTAVGVARARDIKNRKNLSPDTVRRMHSFFSRHAGNETGGEDDAGYISFLLWGGAAGRSWAKRKSAQLDKDENAMSDTRKEIMERLGMAAHPGAKAAFGYQKTVTNLLEEHGVDPEDFEFRNGDLVLFNHHERGRVEQALRDGLQTGEIRSAPRIVSSFSRPGAKTTFAEDAREVAQEILRQLGGGRFMAMVGGKNAFHGTFGGKAGLQFDIGKGADGGVNRVIVKLDRGTDTYDMEFWRIGNRGMNVKKVSEASGVYADDLQRIFTSRTKFYTSLSRPGAKAKMAAAPGVAELERLYAKFQESTRLFTPNKYHDAGEQKRMTSGQKKDFAFFENLLKAARSGDGKRAKTLLAKTDSLLTAHFVPKELRVWAAQFAAHGAKAKMAMIPIGTMRRLKKNYDEYLAYLHRNDPKRKPMSFDEFVDEHKESVKNSPMFDSNQFSRPGAKARYALTDACWQGYEAVGTKQKDGKTVPNCVPKNKNAIREGEKVSASDDAVSRKIRKLMDEGKPQKQAVAIALDLERRGEL